jgi:hypothetical protein
MQPTTQKALDIEQVAIRFSSRLCPACHCRLRMDYDLWHLLK